MSTMPPPTPPEPLPGTPADGASAPTVLDIEASGFGRTSYPIEIGFVLPDGQARCSLIRPLPGWTHWDPAAESVHGISRETLLQHGREPAQVAQMLNEHLSGRIVYCDGWVHDYTWLQTLFDAAGVRPAFRLEHLLRLIDDRHLPAWSAAKLAAAAEAGHDRHRASADARLLQRALIRLRGAP